MKMSNIKNQMAAAGQAGDSEELRQANEAFDEAVRTRLKHNSVMIDTCSFIATMIVIGALVCVLLKPIVAP